MLNEMLLAVQEENKTHQFAVLCWCILLMLM